MALSDQLLSLRRAAGARAPRSGSKLYQDLESLNRPGADPRETMPDAMTTLLANVGLSDLERRLRDEAIDETTFLDLDDDDLKEIGLKMGPRRKLLTAIRDRCSRTRSTSRRSSRSCGTCPDCWFVRRRRRSRLATEDSAH